MISLKTEYSERGLLHAINNKTKLHKIPNIALKAETSALFAKDVITNRFVGKEFHIVKQRKLVNGKVKNTTKLIRVNAPLYKQRGLIHHIVNENRRVEGDTFVVRHSITRKLDSITPKTRKGNYALGVAKGLNSTRKFAQATTKKTILASETVALKLSDIGTNKLKSKATSELDSSDSGKMVLSTITAVSTLNSARKALIEHRIKKADYKVAKKNYKSAKQTYKLKHNNLSKKKLEFKNADSKDKWIAKKQLKLDIKKVKISKYSQKIAKKEKARLKPKSLPRQMTSYSVNVAKQKLSKPLNQSAVDNDAYQGVKASKNVIKKTVKTIYRGGKKVSDFNHSNQKKALHKKENKLKVQESRLHEKIQKKKTPKLNKKPTKKQVVQQIGKVVVNEVSAFSMFCLRFVGVMSIPAIIVILILAVVLSMFGGVTSNSSFVLGTYNASDIEIEKIISSYTKIAYDFNENVMKTQNADEFRNALRNLGVASRFDDTPNTFTFGRNSYQNYDSVWDFNADKLVAFMSAYYYNLESDNEDIKLWTCSWDYKSILQELFDEEYKFEYQYVNSSYWRSLSRYEVYPSATSLWFVESSGTTTHAGTTYGYIKYSGGVPSELSAFTASDSSVHFDLSTGEVKNRNDSYKKTGYYIQNLNYRYNGDTVPSFYTLVDGLYFGLWVDSDLTYHRKTQLTISSGMPFDYAVAPQDVRLWLNNDTETRQLARDYKAEEYVTECALYTNVKQLKTFDEAIKAVLRRKGDYDARVEYYNTLLSGSTYGNHQVFISPFTNNYQSLIDNNRILNYYGYDMRAWNKKHCENLTNCHKGIDLIANSGTNVIAMYDGTVESIDASTYSVTIKSNVNYWYLNSGTGEKIETKITYTNITPKSSLNVGSAVSTGDVMGIVNNNRHCKDNGDNSYGYDFLEIAVQRKYNFYWQDIDPYFLIYR